MTTHDPLCLLAGSGMNRATFCSCGLIAKVRADERERTLNDPGYERRDRRRDADLRAQIAADIEAQPCIIMDCAHLAMDHRHAVRVDDVARIARGDASDERARERARFSVLLEALEFYADPADTAVMERDAARAECAELARQRDNANAELGALIADLAMCRDDRGGLRESIARDIEAAWRDEGHAVMFNHAHDDLTPQQRVGKWLAARIARGTQ